MAVKKVRMRPPGYTDVVHPETSADAVVETAEKKVLTAEERQKLSGIEEEANKYVHPGSGTNPHGTTKADVGLGNVLNVEQATKVELEGFKQNIEAVKYEEERLWLKVDGNWIEVKSGSDYEVAVVTNLTVIGGHGSATLTWVDPGDTTIELSDGSLVTLARWKGTRIVRKVGSYPVNEDDGVVVVNSAVRGQYEVEGYVDTGLTNEVEYFYMAFPYTEDGVFTLGSEGVRVTPTELRIYGVVIDEGSQDTDAVEYTDDAVGFTPMSGNNGDFQWGSWKSVFDDMGIKPVMLKEGVEQYDLNPDDFTKKADGTAADITSGNDGDVMIKFSKIWWKMWKTGTNQYVQWSMKPFDGAICPAHTVGSELRDHIYVSAYLGTEVSGKIRSLSGKTPINNQTLGVMRGKAQANGTGYQHMTYYPLLMLQVLYITFFKDRNSQTALGRGRVDGTGYASTGGADTKGMFFGSTADLQNKFCGIEDFWGNRLYWIDGIFSDSSRNILLSDQTVFNDTGSGYINHGQGAMSNLSGYIGEVQGGTHTGFIVKATTGSITTKYADNGTLNAGRLAFFGGNQGNGDYAGAFQLYVHQSASHSNASISARICWFGQSQA